ncbi:MAG: CBS domain-containing protein [Alphaproteobacteria bacterium]
MSDHPTVRRYMARRLVKLTATMEINRAVAILLEADVSGAPVVDDDERLVGVLSMKDCLSAALHASYHQEWGGTVADYMSSAVETLDADTDIVKAAEFFINSVYRRFPVLEHGRLVGQVSRRDILRALSELW